MGNEVSSKRSEDDYSDDDTSNGRRRRKARSRRKKDEDNAAAFLIDTVCSNFSFYADIKEKRRFGSYSDDEDDDDDDDESLRDRKGRKNKDPYQDDYTGRGRSRRKHDDDTTLDGEDDDDTMVDDHKEDDRASVTSSIIQSDVPSLLSKPLASSFAKKCYFTKSGIGKKTQHYEGLTLTGNVVLMLASAMQLKGCPTICDEDLRRVEQTYPNQFSRLPDELLLSSGWRRISKFCHFSNKPIPDGIPFFHSKERLHPQGGYYFLLASAVGMVRPLDVEPINRDTLVVLETDYAAQCDAAPPQLIHDPDQWTLVDKFCFFSGGPINTEEDVYYVADFEGNPIYMLAFLSPSLTPEELYRLGPGGQVHGEHGFKSISAVEEVESVYDLTERDFDDLKLYHLGPCRALPQYILMPQGWTKVLPPHFMKARQTALDYANNFDIGNPSAQGMHNEMHYGDVPAPAMSPHMNEMGGGEYDPYNQQPQWQQMPNMEQQYRHDPAYNGGGFGMQGVHDMNMQMQAPDGNYYMGQGYGMDGMHNPHQNNPEQPYQSPHIVQGENHQSYFDPEAGFDRGNEYLPGGYDLPTPYDQPNRDNLVNSEEANRLAREVHEEGAFTLGVDNSEPIDEAISNRINQLQSMTPVSSPEKDPEQNERNLSPPIASASGDSPSVPSVESVNDSPSPTLLDEQKLDDDAIASPGESNYDEDANDDVDGGDDDANSNNEDDSGDAGEDADDTPNDDEEEEPSRIIPKNETGTETELSGDEMDSNNPLKYASKESKDELSSESRTRDDEDIAEKETYDDGDDGPSGEHDDYDEPYDHDNLSPERGNSIGREDMYGTSSRNRAPSPDALSPDISYRDHMEEDCYNDKGMDDDYMEPYDVYEEPHRGSLSPTARHPQLHPMYDDDYDYPQDEYTPSRDNPISPRSQLYDDYDEPEPSVDGLSSVGDYASPSRSAFSPIDDALSPRSMDRASPVPSGISEYTPSLASQPSHAMRGAQQILKRNRQKRMAQSSKPATPQAQSRSMEDLHTAYDAEGDYAASDVSGSYISYGGSSMFTDTSMNDRTSRRAIILQMAKARMKGGGKGASSDSPSPSGTTRFADKKKTEVVSPIKETDSQMDDFGGELD